MNFYIQQAARPAVPPIRPAGQATTGSSYLPFLILGGLAIGAYYYLSEPTPAPRSVKSERKMTDAEFAGDWARIEREAKAEREALAKSHKPTRGFRALSSAMKKMFPGTKVSPESGGNGIDLVAKGNFSGADWDRVDSLGERHGFLLKNGGPSEILFEVR